MNLGELRTYVRSLLDCDAEEVSEFMLDAWIREGSDRVHRFTEWPWQDTTWTLATAEQYVDFGDIVDAEGSSPKHVSFVHNGDRRLVHEDPQVLVSRILEEDLTRGEPKWWSQRGGRTLMLHPAPSTAEAYVIQGQRTARDWMADGVTGVPDMPEDLHYAIAFWALGNAYQMLGDGNTSTHFLERSQLTMQEVKDESRFTEFGEKSVMGGGSSYRPQRVLRPANWRVS